MAFDPKKKEDKKKEPREEVKSDDQVSVNPNPRANENLKDKDVNPKNTDKAGSEITDGEAG